MGYVYLNADESANMSEAREKVQAADWYTGTGIRTPIVDVNGSAFMYGQTEMTQQVLDALK
ncbi:MAG: hypothetical protein GY754_29035 [bacterium]|nr:hypothetical protein [bacterium]